MVRESESQEPKNKYKENMEKITNVIEIVLCAMIFVCCVIAAIVQIVKGVALFGVLAAVFMAVGTLVILCQSIEDYKSER